MSKAAEKTVIDLSGFDYKNLQGQSFQDYQTIALQLPANDEFEYEQYMAIGIFKFKLNEDTGEKEEYLFGIKINNTEPVNVSKIPAAYARLLNEQVYAKVPASNSRYYLLKK